VTLLCICGTKGAPGVTTAAFGFARLVGESRPALFVEADPQGGPTSTRLGLSPDPGVASLAATGRHGVSASLLAQNTQLASENLSLLLGPRSPHQAHAALGAIGTRLGSALQEPGDGDAPLGVADLGRLEKESPALTLAQAADRVVFVAAPSLEGTDALALRLAEMPELRHKAMLVTVGEGPYEPVEVAEVLGIPLAARLPWHPAGAEAIWSVRDLEKPRRRGLVLALAEAIEKLGAEPQREDPSPRLRPSRFLRLVSDERQKKEAVR